MTPWDAARLSWAALAAGLATLGALLWFVGPLLTVGSGRPLESVDSRLAAIGLLLGGAAALALWRRWRAGTGSASARAEAALDRALAAALLPQPGLVRELRTLPWALVLGAPGAGHHAVLAAAGFGEIAGSADCRWRATDHGALIDAAEGLADGGSTWQHLLHALKRTRPLQPLNAVLLAVSAADLAGPAAARRKVAAALAQRVAEVHAALGVQPPVQLLVTHGDRVDGFPAPAAQQRLRSAAADAGLPHEPASCLLDSDPAALRRFVAERVFDAAAARCFDAAWLRRRRLAVRAAYGATLMVLAGLAAAWMVSRVNNAQLVAAVAARLPALEQQVAMLPPPTDDDAVVTLPALDAVRHVVRDAGGLVDDPPLLSGFGLYQGDKLDAAARLAYQRLLRDALWPRVSRRIEARLRATAGAGDLALAYEALKAYLMPYVPEHFDAGLLRAWLTLEWDSMYPGAAREPQRAALQDHLDAMLALGPLPEARPPDSALVDQVRARLSRQPLAERVYARIKALPPGDGPAFTVVGAAGPQASRVFERASGRPLTEGIAGLYTKAGYERVFEPAVQPTMKQLVAEAAWVLGQPADASQRVDRDPVAAIADQVSRLYFADYVKAWDDYLVDVRLVKTGSLRRRVETAQLLSAPDSALAAYLRGVAAQTRLVAAGPAGRAVEGVVGAALKAINVAPTPGAGGLPLARLVDDHFAALQRLVSGQPAPIDRTLELLGAFAASAGSADATQRLAAQAATLPQPLRPMIEQLAVAGAGDGAQDLMADFGAVAGFCQQAIAGRYPFVPSEPREVALADFAHLFGAGGQFDRFFQAHLAARVDTSGRRWMLRPGVDVPVLAATLDSFQRAARLREVFFADGGATPSFRIELRLSPLQQSKRLPIPGLQVRAGSRTTTLLPGKNALVLAWPLEAGGAVELALPGAKAAGLIFEGPWAPFRLLDAMTLKPTSTPDRYTGTIRVAGVEAALEVRVPSVVALDKAELRLFRCPSTAAGK